MIVDGIRFASKAEAARDAELVLLEKAGEITSLVRQPRYPLKVHGELIATYVPDWSYVEKVSTFTSIHVCEDKKGVETDVFKIKFKLAKVLYPRVCWRTS